MRAPTNSGQFLIMKAILLLFLLTCSVSLAEITRGPYLQLSHST